MAIEKTTDNYKNSLFDETFDVATTGDENKLTRTTDDFQQFPRKTTVTIIADSLDSSTLVTFKNGSSETFSELGSWLDANNEPIVIGASNGTNNYPVNIDAPIIGFQFEKLSATAGTVKILIKA